MSNNNNSSYIGNQLINENKIEEVEKEKFNKKKITIIVGSTNFYLIFGDKRETIPVLILFYKDVGWFGNDVLKIIQSKTLNNSMIFFDFLYYLDKIYKSSKKTLTNRNLFNIELEKKLESNQIISFDYEYLSEKINRKNMDGINILPSIDLAKQFHTVQSNKTLNKQTYTSEDLLNLYFKYLIKEKLNNINEEFELDLILPLYLNETQKKKIENIFRAKLKENGNNEKKVNVNDEMNYYLGNINKKFENKIIFIHFGGSSLVVVLYDYDNKKIIKKKEKLIGGIDIDIMLTKDSLTKFKNENNGCPITDISLIYKVKNEIEEEKKKLFSNNKDKLEINIENFKHNKPLKYELNDKDEILLTIDDILEGFENIIKNILEDVNKEEIKNVICIGNNFKFIIIKNILFQYLPEELCEFIFE